VIFVDSNVPMYLMGDDRQRKLAARHVLERLAGEQKRLVTSSEVFQEVLHRYGTGSRRDRIEPAFETLRGLVEDVLAVEGADVFAAKDLIHAHPRLSARDALHVAVMRRHEIREIVSFDRGFDAVSGLRRLPGEPGAG
jgi:predicted nucleic acid-binding protein